MKKSLPVNIEIDNYNKLKVNAENERLQLKAYVNKLVTYKLQRDELLVKFYPTLKRISLTDNVLYILDRARKDTAQVRLINKKLECDIEKSDHCEHVLFAFLCDDFPDVCVALLD